MESNLGNNRLEQKTEINKPDDTNDAEANAVVSEEQKPVKVKEAYATVEDMSALKQELLEAISGLKPEEPEEAPAKPEAQVEAEVIIPADTGSPSEYGQGVEKLDDGWIKIVPTNEKESD